MHLSLNKVPLCDCNTFFENIHIMRLKLRNVKLLHSPSSENTEICGHLCDDDKVCHDDICFSLSQL